MFVDSHARSGVRYVDITKTTCHRGIANSLLNFVGDIDELSATGRPDAEGFHAGTTEWE